MGQFAVFVKHLIAAGVTGDALVRAVEDMEASVVVQTPEQPARSKAAERQARYRARKAGDGGGGDGRVTSDKSDARDVTTVTNVTVCDAENNLSPQTPLSRITSPTGNADAREARIALQHRSGELIDAARKLVNGSADWTQPNMHRTDLFIELMTPMSGIPCDWELDIAPAIQTAAAKFHGKRGLTSWNYIRPIAIENRDRRLAGLPEPKAPEPRHEPARPRPGGFARTGNRSVVGEAEAFLAERRARSERDRDPVESGWIEGGGYGVAAARAGG